MAARAKGAARRIVRLFVCVVAGLAIGICLDVALVRSGLIRNPFAPIVGGDIGLARSDRPGLRVLFVGNSFTYENDMPALVHRLGASSGRARPIFAVEYTAPGWRLRRAAADHGLETLLRTVRWDWVVLQEQSEIPSLAPERRRRDMYPFARALQQKIRAAGARTLLFMTWAYEHGDDAAVPHDSFAAMQARLAAGYDELGRELRVPVAPVGLAWAAARRADSRLRLWQGDGRHPSRVGAYLSACVFYAVLTGRDPAASRFGAGLTRREARVLRRAAWHAVRASRETRLRQLAGR